MIDSLCADCRTHFERVLGLLASQGLRPTLQPYMVRGLDYYCRTAFEVIGEGLGAQNALGGGGRYRITSYNVCYTKLLRFKKRDPVQLVPYRSTAALAASRTLGCVVRPK